MNNDAIEAMRHLERAETILARLTGYEKYQKRVTDVRAEMGNELMAKAYAEAIEQADIGDLVIGEESDGTVTYLDGTEVQDE